MAGPLAPPRGASMLAFVVLAQALAGCAFLDGLEDRPVLVSTDLFQDSFNFAAAPEGPPPIPPTVSDLNKRFTRTFDVPEGAADLNVTVVVTFDAPATGLGNPQGTVTINLEAPSNTGDEATVQRSGPIGWLKADPPAGTWALTFETQGSGEIAISVVAQVPAAG